MFRLFKQLPRTPQAMNAHIKALRSLVLAEEHRDIFEHLYECLSILDAKSSSLLSFNSIIIAVFAIFLTRPLSSAEWLLVNGGMMTVLLSAFLLLSVVWVHWSSTPELNDAGEHGRRLLEIRNSRTVRYRISWYLAVVSLLALLGILFAGYLAGPEKG